MPYAPFHETFPDIAENETRSLIIHSDSELPDDKYVFTEAYCDEENCDCRRVFFNVFSEKTRNNWPLSHMVGKNDNTILIGWEIMTQLL